MASSLLTSSAAMAALQHLSDTQKALSTTQGQIASGLRISAASDNAAYWSISSALRSDIGAQSAVSDALNLGSSVVATATAAITSTLTLLNRIKADLVTAQQPGTSAAAVQTDIAAQQQSLMSILSSASFNGVNLLDGSAGTSPSVLSAQDDEAAQDDGAAQDDQADDGPSDGSGLAVAQSRMVVFDPVRPVSPSPIAGPVLVAVSADTVLSFVTSFQRSSSGGTTLGTVGLDTTATNLIGAGGVLDGAPGGSGSTSIVAMDVTAPGASLATMQADTEAAIASVAAIGALIGGIGTTLTSQQAYVASLSSAMASGVGSLVDADMNVASTRLQALQTQEQLGVQALSIANGNSRLVLKLFEAA